MATDEKYLDDLLKSLEENPAPPRKFNFENEKREDEEDSLGRPADDLVDMLDKMDEKTIIQDEEEPDAQTDVIEENSIAADSGEAAGIAEEYDIFAQVDATEEADTAAEAESIGEGGRAIEDSGTAETISAPEPDHIEDNHIEDEEWKKDLDSLLAEADKARKQEEEPGETAVDQIEETAAEQEEAMPDAPLLSDADSDETSAEGIDITQLIDGMDGPGEDWEEIGDLLKKSDQNQAIDDDMLALLESVSEEGGGNAGEAFDVFAEAPDDAENQSGISKKNLRAEKKEERRRKRSEKREKRKRGRQQESVEQESEKKQDNLDETLAVSPEDTFAENFVGVSEDEAEEAISDIEERTEDKKKDIQKTKAEKKTGFFAKLFQLLTQEEEEEEARPALDENGEILNELEQEDLANSKKKKKKEKKAKKEKKEKKAESKAGAEGEEDEEDEQAADKGKKKKAKKVKKEKPEGEKEKPVKVLTRKSMLVLVAFCATLIAAIVSCSIFLTDYADRKNARTAFYQGEYETAYELLYNKKLNESDRVIFNRIDIILRLERKLEAYKNYKNMGMELEALDALLQGVTRYDALAAQAAAYGAADEAQDIYRQILTELSDTYQISEEEARETNGYDSSIYTRKLESVINGTEFVKPGEEEPLPPQDILPEEEEIITL